MPSNLSSIGLTPGRRLSGPIPVFRAAARPARDEIDTVADQSDARPRPTGACAECAGGAASAHKSSEVHADMRSRVIAERAEPPRHRRMGLNDAHAERLLHWGRRDNDCVELRDVGSRVGLDERGFAQKQQTAAPWNPCRNGAGGRVKNDQRIRRLWLGFDEKSGAIPDAEAAGRLPEPGLGMVRRKKRNVARRQVTNFLSGGLWPGSGIAERDLP